MSERLDALIKNYQDKLKFARTGKLEIRADGISVFKTLLQMVINDLVTLKEKQNEN